MPRHHCKSTDNIRAMSPLELSHLTIASPEYSNTLEAEENDLQTNFMKMIELLKEEINDSLKKIQGGKTNNWSKLINPSKKTRKTQTIGRN